MVTVFAITDLQASVREAIASVSRLDELVSVEDWGNEAIYLNNLPLKLNEQGLWLPLPWDHSHPPYQIPHPLTYTPETLLGIIFHFLGNDQRAWEYLHNLAIYPSIELQNRIKYGYPIESSGLTASQPQNYFEAHNLAVIHHYGDIQGARLNPQPLYEAALQLAPESAYRAFSTRELATFLMDHGHLRDAQQLLERELHPELPPEAYHALAFLWVKVSMQVLTAPYDRAHLDELKQVLWETLQYFEQFGKELEVAMLLMEATQIALISESFAEGLGYVKRAVGLFADAEIPELQAEAQLRQGTLLHTWAQQGNPQFYPQALQSYQQALKVFSKEQSPQIFADIHHSLGLLYAEMPADKKKKGIWAGVSSASFNEALEFYTAEAYPYQHASICSNYANSLTRYPKAIHSDNFEKALSFYSRALAIRTADYPYERAITLLNYLDISWKVGNDPETFNTTRFDDMQSKAREVKSLVEDPQMIQEAEQHLEDLEKLRAHIEKV